MQTVTEYGEIVHIHALARQDENILNLHAILATEYAPQFVPDHFVPGPMFVAVTADVDCDGTGYASHGIPARNLAEAKDIADRKLGNYSGWSVMTVDEFRHTYGADAVSNLFDEPLHVNDDGPHYYASLYNIWNPWVEDDTIGIPALDHRLDD